MRPPFRLVGEHPSSDTVQVLTELLDLAQRGDLIGVAFVGMYKRKQLQTGAAGEARRSPVFTLGAVRVLEQSVIHHIGSS